MMVFSLGWILLPFALKLAYGNCSSVSYFSHNEEGRFLESNVIRTTYKNGNEHLYSSLILITLENNEKISKKNSRLLKTNWYAKKNFLKVNVSNATSFELLEWEWQVNKYSEVGVAGDVYFFKTKGGRVMTGNKNIPMSLCNTTFHIF